MIMYAPRVYPVKVQPKTLQEFIAQYDGMLTSWIRGYGFMGAELEDAKQDIYAHFLRKSVVEVFDPAIPKCADFLAYIRIKVNRLLSSRYRKQKRVTKTFGTLSRTDEEGDEHEVEVEDRSFSRKDEIGRWWQDHVSLLQDPAVRRPVVLKQVDGIVYVVTPMLVLNMVLMGYSGEDIMQNLKLSRVCFNRVRTVIREKLGSCILWGDGGD